MSAGDAQALRIVTLALAALVPACSAQTSLTIDVRTDYLAGTDFVTVQTEVSATEFVSPSPEGMITTHAASAGDWLSGVRVDERSGLTAGDWHVRVTLLAASRTRVAQRSVAVHFTDRRSLVVVLARACAGVVCPPSGSPTLTECSGGTCVSPTCSVENPLACPPPECANDADCASPGPCARATCASGVCLAAPDDGLCGGGTCGADYRCIVTHGDGGSPIDGGIDASTPVDAWAAPTFVLRRLPRGGTSWSVVTTSGDAPTDPIEAAFAMPGTDEIMVLTHTELFVLRVSTRTFVERRPRDPIFPELAGIEIRTAVGVNGTIYVTSHDTWLYGWNDAARSATFMQMIRHEDLGSDWHGPLTPPWFSEYASFYAPDNADAWASVDPMQLCGPTVANYIAYLSWDGFGPAAMITTVWDAGCFQFVDRSVYGASDYVPFTLPGAPPDPFSITAAEWYEGLWVFSTS